MEQPLPHAQNHLHYAGDSLKCGRYIYCFVYFWYTLIYNNDVNITELEKIFRNEHKINFMAFFISFSL